MSFLIIGNDLASLYLAKSLKELGWKVTLMTKDTFDYGPEYCIVDDLILDKLDLKYRLGLVKSIDSVELSDLYNNKRVMETDTKLFDLGVYKNLLFGELRKKVDYYQNSTYIDKNGENIFIKVNNHGTLIKARYVINFEDLELSAKLGNEIKYVDHLFATIKRHNAKKDLNLFFLSNCYGYVTNYTSELAHISMFGYDLNTQFDDYIKINNLESVQIYTQKIPLFNKIVKAHKNNEVFMAGNALCLTNNLNYDNIEPALMYCLTFKNFFHKLMTNDVEDYNSKLFEFTKTMYEKNKHAKYFWKSTIIVKNDLINYYSPRYNALDFSSMFRNLPKLSKHRIKMFFS